MTTGITLFAATDNVDLTPNNFVDKGFLNIKHMFLQYLLLLSPDARLMDS